MPIGEQGADIARTASVMAGYAETVSGVQINRFCASGLEATNMAAAQVMSGQSQAAIGGGVESMSRVPMGSDGGAWAVDPAVAIPMYFVPQGVSADLIATKYGMSRDDVDAYAVESQRRAKAAWDAGYFKKSIVPVRDQNGIELLAHDEFLRPTTTMQTLAALEPSFKMQGEMMRASTRWRSSATRKSRRSITSTMPATRRASSTAPPPSWSAPRSSARRRG